MEKTRAIEMFGSVLELASALGITRQAIYQWPQRLTQDQEDRVLGAAIRIGLIHGARLSSASPAHIDHRTGADRRHHERRAGEDRRDGDRRDGERRRTRTQAPDRREGERRDGKDRRKGDRRGGDRRHEAA